MRYRLKLLKPVISTGELGGEKVTFEETVTVWAERVKVTPHFSRELGEFFSDYTVEFNIRDAHTVEEGWRAEQMKGYLYEVINIIPNRDRGMLTLRVKRVNE